MTKMEVYSSPLKFPENGLPECCAQRLLSRLFMEKIGCNVYNSENLLPFYHIREKKSSGWGISKTLKLPPSLTFFKIFVKIVKYCVEILDQPIFRKILLMGRKGKENWGSQLGVILAVAGSAIGLGNFLRFPGQAVMHGGGAFMIPYFISFLIIGIPLTWSEWAIGRAGGRRGFNSVPGIFSLAAGGKRRWSYIGSLGAFIPVAIVMYYLFIEAWCLAFAIQYFLGFLAQLGLSVPSFLPGTNGAGFTLGSAEAYQTFFKTFVGADADGSLYRTATGSFALTPLLGCTIFCLLLNFYLIYRGVSKGIEAFCKVAMPLLFICSVLILIRALTLHSPSAEPGRTFLDGLGFMWNPSQPDRSFWDSITDPDVWLAATSQIFFSVSIGFGLIVTYASYVKPKDDIALSALTATVSNEFCEVVLAGLMIIPPAIMFMGVSGLEGNLGTFSLGFNVLPNVFEQMPCGQFFGFLFFVLLFLAAVTSSISMVQPSVALFEEGLNFGRKRAICLTAVISLVGTTLLCHFSKGLYALDTLDFWAGQFGLFVLATLQTILVSWIWGPERMLQELRFGSRIYVPKAICWGIKYVSTPYLVLILILWLYKNAGAYLNEAWVNPIARLVVGFIVFMYGVYMLVTFLSLRRWKRMGIELRDVAKWEIDEIDMEK